MKIAVLIFLCLAWAASAETNQNWQACRNPVRVFGPHSSVNLEPLFQWWARQPIATNAAGYTVANISTNAPVEADRPLSAWHRVTGAHANTVAGSWVVDAVIYTSPTARTNARIFLNHPPTLEEQNYLNWKSQIALATQQITNAARAHHNAEKAEDHDLEREQAYRHFLTKPAPTSANNYARRAAEQHAMAAAAAKEQKRLEALRNEIETQLKTIPSSRGDYAVDWFAVLVGHTKQGFPIYDLGVVPPAPQ